MGTISPAQKFSSLGVSGKYSYPNGFGRLFFNWSRYGFEDPDAGVYRRHPTKSGQIVVQNKHYWPVDTITPARLAVRDKFIAGMIAWQALSESQKKYWNTLHSPKNMSGCNRFMRLWLKA